MNVQNQEAEEFKIKCEEYLNGWKRAKADFINYQKDESRRFESIIKFTNENLIVDLILVLDSFDLAIKSLKNPSEIKALSVIRSQLEDLLKKNGLQRIEVSLGEIFNPALYEAVAEVSANEASTSNSIVEEVEKGYTLHGKLIRPVKVKITK